MVIAIFYGFGFVICNRANDLPTLINFEKNFTTHLNGCAPEVSAWAAGLAIAATTSANKTITNFIFNQI
jgi:hypothetical protein